MLSTFFVSTVTSASERSELLKIFHMFDKNGDGQLSKKELLEGYQLVMKKNEVEREVASIMKFCDIDGNGLIDFSEFVTICVDRKNLLQENCL